MQRPRIKREHFPERLPGGRIRIGTLQFGVGAEVQDDKHGSVWRLLGLMDGTRDRAGIVAAMLTGGGAFSGTAAGDLSAPDASIAPDDSNAIEVIEAAIEAFIAAGYVEDAAAAPPPELSPSEIDRYRRSTSYFSWVDTRPRPSPYAAQQRLKRANVTLLGLGGTGCAVAMSLAAAGVGRIHCVDGDRVELSNLNRQLLYGEADLGRTKVAAAVDRLSRLNSHVAVTGQVLSVRSPEDVVPLMRGRDLFVLCADMPANEIQLWVNDAALQTNTRWIQSAYAGPMLVVGTFAPFETPCYRCISHAEHDRRELRDGGNAAGLWPPEPANAVIAPTANLSGQLAALEALYLLADLKPQTLGRIFHQNLMVYDHTYYIEAPFWPECPACGPGSPFRRTVDAAEPSAAPAV